MESNSPKYSVQPILPGGDVNLLEEYVFGKPQSDKRAERLARSQVARRRRSEAKEIKQRKDVRDRTTKA